MVSENSWIKDIQSLGYKLEVWVLQELAVYQATKSQDIVFSAAVILAVLLHLTRLQMLSKKNTKSLVACLRCIIS